MTNKKKLLEIVSDNYWPIFVPFIIGICVAVIAILASALTHNTKVANVILGISGLIISTSGYWQVKMKVVPGYPTLRGGCAVIFGVCFLVFTAILGTGLIISTILGL